MVWIVFHLLETGALQYRHHLSNESNPAWLIRCKYRIQDPNSFMNVYDNFNIKEI